MAWNQPGNRNNDPWRGKDPNREVQAFVARLRGMFGGGGGGRPSEAFNPLPLVAGLLLVWLVFDSFKMIDARERGVVLRFGEFSRMMEPGANFKLPRPIERVVVVQAQEVAATSDQMLVLTRDENLVEIGYNVQFQITEPKDFLFGTRDPRDLIRQITESAVREAIGNADLDTALNRRDTLTPGVQEAVQAALDNFNTGLTVTSLGLPIAAPPAPVKPSFDDVIAAEQDAQRFQNDAKAYEGEIVPQARGQAARTVAAANGYREAVVARAEGEAQRFELLLAEYRKAPDVTRKRLYLETVQQVLAENPRVLAAAGGNTLLLQLPGSEAPAPQPQPPAPLVRPAVQAAAVESAPPPSRSNARTREGAR
ncbi:FtsH protease activity modulator HflK [Silanimonas lenta]|uniref:FtsH protease activity modulator HflK n=2 Tax=Silanimonas lenta TaxID=265429 RepID=UPI00041B254C|nr:FtsH protease activity modulator HflK [Silanimonas lenta]